MVWLCFVHVVEQYVTYPVNAKVQDRFAEGLLLNLIEDGPKALENPTEYDQCANLMLGRDTGTEWVDRHWCACRLGNSHDWSGNYRPVWFGSCTGPLWPWYSLPVWLLQKEQKKAKLLQYAERVWGLHAGDDSRVMAAIENTRQFFEKMGVPTRLSAYGSGCQRLTRW